MSDQATTGASTPRLPAAREDRTGLPNFGVQAPIAVGTLVWVVLAVIAVIRYDDLTADGHGWYLWTAVIGAVLGLAGFLYVRLRPPRD